MTSPSAPRTSRAPAWVKWAAIACVPALAGIVLVLVAGRAPRPAPSPPAPLEAAAALDPHQAAARVEQLSARLRANREDADAWTMLGQALATLGRFGEAADALGEAVRRRPGNASLLAERADVLAMARGRRFAGEPDLLIHAALEADPRHTKALALAGTSAFDRGAYAEAASYWRRLLAIVPPGGPMAREVEARTLEAERRAAGKARL